MKRRLTALIMAVLMLIQLLPVLAVAETVGEIISDVLTAPEMHTVSFLVDGEKIHTVFVQDGSALGILPDAPEYDSQQFDGWYVDGELLTVDYIVSADVTAEGVYADIAPQTNEKTFDFGTLVLSGIVPDELDVTAEDVTKQYVDIIKNAYTVYAWNISMQQEDAAYIADKESPVTVSVQLPERTDKVDWQIWQLLKDQDWSEVTDYIINDGTAIFDVFESGVYLIAESIQIRTLRATDTAYDISVTYGADANLPADGLELIVSEITAKDADYENYVAAVADKVGAKVENISLARAFDIRIVSEKDHDVVYEPMSNVNVMIRLPGEALGEYEHVDVLHFIQTRGTKLRSTMPVVDDMEETIDGETITFTTDNFSIYVVAGYTLEKIIQASDGNTYKISVTFGKDALLPDDAELDVQELQGELLDDYIGRTAVVMNAAGFEYARVFDISIVGNDGTVLQPGAEVQVSIELLDAKDTSKDFSVVHFGEETADPVTSITEGNTVKFSASGFSAYAIVQGPGAIAADWKYVQDLEELAAFAADNTGVYIGHTSGYYFTNKITKISSSRTGITKTMPAMSTPPLDAVLYYFIPQNGTNKYKVYCWDGSTKKYIVQSGNSLNLTESENAASVFTMENGNEASIFRGHGSGDFYWNMQGGATGGVSFAAYTGGSDVNAQFRLWYREPIIEDPYSLNGKSYGLMNWTNSVSGRAMMASSTIVNNLDAKALTVMTKMDDHEDKLFVPNDSDITIWQFEWTEDDRYYLKANVDGTVKYLQINDNGLALVSEPDDNCKLQLIPGLGQHAGQISLNVNNKPIVYTGDITTGFEAGGTAGAEWLYMVDLDELTTDYYMIHKAVEVSVSDDSITNGSKVIVYSRVWNDTTKQYEFYAIDHDGTLVRCYESGNEIQWVSGQLNTMLWNLVEYYYEGTNDPNYYYELYNPYSGKFIAPQVTGNQILSNDTIGINLTGRRNGEYYSTIIAWDNPQFTYAYIKADRDQRKIITIPQSMSADAPDAVEFGFAIVQDLPVDDKLMTVPTVDHERYGITMRIKNFGSRLEMSNFLGNNDGGVGNTLHQGLLSNSLGADGYPTTAGGSLGQLLGGARQVNHLFIEGTYNSSGYFVFDSTQNFASLQENNQFIVYRELGTHDTYSRETLKHGQFFPFNYIEAGVYASVNSENLYNVNAELLDDSDPRKHEPLYLIPKPDYYFAVELEASFVQTPNGLDAWGHDIIYQFTGDDDFWLYVDGELVIDLGGIHSAVPGWVNYRTGEVSVNGIPTTLRNLFYNNYLKRDNHTVAQAEAYVDNIFELKNGHYVFKDNTTHTMKIFYMERGAGASNLQMRFNLASIKKGTVLLSKELGNVDNSESILAKFPFQIRYKLGDNIYYLQPNVNENAKVVYKDTSKNVDYMQTLEIDGITYNNVFILKPGETVEIDFGLGTDVTYEIVECGTDSNVYESVLINGSEVTGSSRNENPDRKDYSTGFQSSRENARINYVNNVDEEAIHNLTIEKHVFREDGKTELNPDEDNGMFTFRLYLGTEIDSVLAGADMYTYHILDWNKNYCRWDTELQTFVAIGQNKNDFDSLSFEEKQSASFVTSMNGSITNVPTGFAVQIRELLAGTKFEVEERSYEIPDGYSLQRYELNEEGIGLNKPAGQMTKGQDQVAGVYNRRGFGFRINKVWADTDYMSERDATYFALFAENDDNNELILAPGSVRKMLYNESTLYWYCLTLPFEDVPDMDNYVIREVVLIGGTPTVNENGIVSGFDSLIPINEQGTVKLNGKQKGETVLSKFTYTVHYDKGIIPTNSTVRVDTATNSRPGITFLKQNWANEPVKDATFTLMDDTESLIGTFTSDTNGWITDAFLRKNVDYTLTEITTPEGYQGLPAAITVRMNSDDSISVSGVDSEYYTIIPSTGENNQSVAVKNRSNTLKIFKMTEGDSELIPLSGAHFALHMEKTVDGVTAIDLNPEPGYEDLESDENGLIPGLDETLPSGTYELREIQTASGGYMDLDGYITFTISPMHVVTLGTVPDGVTLESMNNEDGSISYVITVLNDLPRLTLTKHVSGSFADYNQEFTFTLTVAGAQSGATYSYTKGTTTGSVENGGTFVLRDSETITFILPAKVNVTISENDNANGIYQKTWTMISGSAATVSGNQMTVVLNKNSVYTIENHLDAISPTGYYATTTPYLWIMGAGVLLLLLKCFRKKRSTEEGGWSS